MNTTIKTLRATAMAAIEALNPGEHYMITAADMARLNEKSLRTSCSAANLQYGVHLKVHKDEQGNLWVWHDPTPRETKIKLSPIFAELVDARKQYEVAHDSGNTFEANRLAGVVNELLARIQDEHKAKLRKKARGSIHCTNEEAQDHLKIPANIWEMIAPRDRVQLRIQAGIELRELEARKAQQEKANGVVVQAIEIPNQLDSAQVNENKLEMDSAVLKLMGLAETGKYGE